MITEPIRQRRTVAELIPAAYNPRKISPEALRGLSESMRRFGLVQPIIVNDRTGHVVGGHQRLKVLESEGIEEIDVLVVDLDDTEERALNVALNNPQISGEFDDGLDELLNEIRDHDVELFDALRLDTLISELEEQEKREDTREDQGPEALQGEATTQFGDIWLLGDHTLCCGDSTDRETVARLLGLAGAPQFVHADPPYGMGKEGDGVANDNLYGPKLDAFQTAWWMAASPSLADNASAFVWGNAEDLWRWWFTGGLQESEPRQLTMRNEVVWDKKNVAGQGSDALHSFPSVTERALFFKLGKQFMGNLNKDDFADGHKPILEWMISELEANGWTKTDANRITGTRMAGHWFSRSQFMIISRKRYEQLRAEAERLNLPGFRAPYSKVGGGVLERIREKMAAELKSKRSHFDATHDSTMTEVFHDGRVVGDERHGHATPKPVDMVERVIVTCCPHQGVVYEPFGGSGSTLIAADRAERVCAMMELLPGWCDVIVRRWEAFTGREAVLEGDGRTFAEIALERGPEA